MRMVGGRMGRYGVISRLIDGHGWWDRIGWDGIEWGYGVTIVPAVKCLYILYRD